MKRILLIIALITFSMTSVFSQSILNIWGGAGIANRYNYDVAPQAGIDYTFGIFDHVGLGISAFYKNFSYFYDKENLTTLYGVGDGGFSLRNLSNYAFATIKLDYAFAGRNKNLHFYVKTGPGFLLGGTETVHSFANSYIAPPFITSYNDTVNTSKNIKSMVYYIGVGFTEFSFVTNRFVFSLSEDFGYLTSSLTKTTDPNSAYHTQYSPTSFNPFYFSINLGIGFRHSRESYSIMEF